MINAIPLIPILSPISINFVVRLSTFLFVSDLIDQKSRLVRHLVFTEHQPNFDILTLYIFKYILCYAASHHK